jgi:hypothetical protein
MLPMEISREEADADAEWRRWIRTKTERDCPIEDRDSQAVLACCVVVSTCCILCIMTVMLVLGLVFGLVAWVKFAWNNV